MPADQSESTKSQERERCRLGHDCPCLRRVISTGAIVDAIGDRQVEGRGTVNIGLDSAETNVRCIITDGYPCVVDAINRCIAWRRVPVIVDGVITGVKDAVRPGSLPMIGSVP